MVEQSVAQASGRSACNTLLGGSWGLSKELRVKGQGDLVSRLRMGILGVIYCMA